MANVINSFTVKERKNIDLEDFTPFDRDITVGTEFDNNLIEQIKFNNYKNEQLDTGEIIYYSDSNDDLKVWSRLKFDNSDTYDWYITDSDVEYVASQPGVAKYKHVIKIVELVKKLQHFMVSNISFDDRVSKNTERSYNHYGDVVERIRQITPFDRDQQLEATRAFDTYTPRCWNLLISNTNVKEFKFSNKNCYEVLYELFLILGAIPKLVANDNEDQSLALDFEYLSEDVGSIDKFEDDPDVEFLGFTSRKSTGNYLTNAEVNIQNVIDPNSTYTYGPDIGRPIQSSGVLLNGSDEQINLDVPIYQLIKFEMASQDVENWTDVTDYVLPKGLRRLLPKGRNVDGTLDNSEVNLSNSVEYDIGGVTITGWMDKIKRDLDSANEEFTWQLLTDSAGAPTESEITKYRFRINYIPQVKNHRLFITTDNFIDSNVRTTSRINSGDRLNEFSYVMNNVKNQLNRLGSKEVCITCRVRNLDSGPAVGTFVKQYGLYVVSESTTQTNKVTVDATEKSIVKQYVLTDELSIMPDNVNVDKSNRYTDVEIGGGLQREETLEDFILFEEGDVSRVQDSLLNNGFLSYIMKSQLTTLGPDKPIHGQFIMGNDFGDAYAIDPIIQGGAGVVNYKLLFKNQAFVTDRIEYNGTTEIDELVGIPYTDRNGELKDISFQYRVPNQVDGTGVIKNPIGQLSGDELLSTMKSYPLLYNDLTYDDGSDIMFDTAKIVLSEAGAPTGDRPEIVDVRGDKWIELDTQGQKLSVKYDVIENNSIRTFERSTKNRWVENYSSTYRGEFNLSKKFLDKNKIDQQTDLVNDGTISGILYNDVVNSSTQYPYIYNLSLNEIEENGYFSIYTGLDVDTLSSIGVSYSYDVSNIRVRIYITYDNNSKINRYDKFLPGFYVERNEELEGNGGSDFRSERVITSDSSKFSVNGRVKKIEYRIDYDTRLEVTGDRTIGSNKTWEVYNYVNSNTVSVPSTKYKDTIPFTIPLDGDEFKHFLNLDSTVKDTIIIPGSEGTNGIDFTGGLRVNKSVNETLALNYTLNHSTTTPNIIIGEYLTNNSILTRDYNNAEVVTIYKVNGNRWPKTETELNNTENLIFMPNLSLETVQNFDGGIEDYLYAFIKDDNTGEKVVPNENDTYLIFRTDSIDGSAVVNLLLVLTWDRFTKLPPVDFSVNAVHLHPFIQYKY